MDETPRLAPIAQDARGASWSLLLPDGEEAVLIFTRKGFYRGGHSHDRPETSMVLTGKMRYKKRLLNGREISFVQVPGETLHNRPGQVHLALALEDTWLLDWKIGTKKGESNTTNYPPYRAYVDDQIGGLAPST